MFTSRMTDKMIADAAIPVPFPKEEWRPHGWLEWRSVLLESSANNVGGSIV